jgi:hypothetical protein
VTIRMSRAIPYFMLGLGLAARPVVSTGTLDTDISILIHNDLLGKGDFSIRLEWRDAKSIL